MNQICPLMVAVIIPSYRVKGHLLNLISKIGPECDLIYVVDDHCPEKSGEYVSEFCTDPRVRIIFNPQNLGVGGAVIAGYRAAIKDGATILVKVDGDGQMDPELIPEFIKPILAGEADYTKGNRFYDLEHINRMPKLRLIGNSILSFMTKLSSGYWDIFDPTNGFTAIHSDVAKRITFSRVSNRYFFESDMLFRLNILRAVVVDIPMDAFYGNESSSLSVKKIIGEFFYKHARNFIKRVFYNYYLRDMSLASLELPIGVFLIAFGITYGVYHWYIFGHQGMATPLGTVMLASLALLFGLQFVLAFLAYDIATIPRKIIHRK